MYRHFVAALAVFCLALPAVVAQDSDAAPATVVKLENDAEASPASLDDAKTVADVEAWAEAKQQEVQVKAFAGGNLNEETIGNMIKEMAVNNNKAAEKMITLAKTNDEKVAARKKQVEALKMQDQAERMPLIIKAQKEIQEAEGDEEDTQAKMMKKVAEIQSMETEAQKKLAELLVTLEKEEIYAKLVKSEQYEIFAQKEALPMMTDPTPERFETFKKAMFEWAAKAPESETLPSPLEFLTLVAGLPPVAAMDPELSEKTMAEVLAFLKAEDCPLDKKVAAALLAKIEGPAKRKMGADLELYGKTLDDKDFDWKALRGKYVLVKFTASWCGPCKGEIPGMKEAYEKYRDKGLEIISVYVWDELDNVKETVKEENLPWIILSEELTEKAGQPKQGETYSVDGVPTMLLVDKEGKVIGTEMRGDALKRKLAEIFDGEKKADAEE